MSALVNVDVGAGEVVTGLMDGLDKLFTSDDERAKAALIKFVEEQKPHVMQAEANIVSASHASWFVAGPRPAMMWVCAIGLGYQVLIYPFAGLIAHFAGLPSDLPPLDGTILMNMTMALLGLSGLRTWEKWKGVAGSDRPTTGGKRQPQPGDFY